MKMNQLFLTAVSSLVISTPSFASSYSPFDSFDFDGCTKSSPCYWDGGQWQQANDSDDPWNSYTITTFTISLGVALFYPLILRAVDYGVDYVAYKFNRFSALRDGGGAAQKKELEGIKRSLINNNGEGALAGIESNIRILRRALEGEQLTKQEQKDALKLISDAVTNTGQDSVAALNEGVEEIKKNNVNLEKLLTTLVTSQKKKAEDFLENQKLQNEFNQNMVSQLQQSQLENTQALNLALDNFSKALKELKSDGS